MGTNRRRLFTLAKKPRYYAVAQGCRTGTFNKWDGGARIVIDGFPDADHRSFRTLELAPSSTLSA
ncbi:MULTISPECIES: RNase H1/viroplasmin domain-containing protein [unclassified Pseudomonas]|uniref:RNase H1/viroplasmin domain-containing protein n=1 Tax=unclassified Pseudomonas TaxID=196821 RepID=UPI002114A218|nr:RNase H1/viroplasmin domain-containing protein [Pseudomonas sp. Irchel 3A7]